MRMLHLILAALVPALPAQAHALDAQRARVLVACWRAAYQDGGPVMLLDRRTATVLARLRLPTPARALDELTAAAFDPAHARLVHRAKGRGIGDCGESARWLFDGREFRLEHYASMPVCAGFRPEDWPVSWRAEAGR